MRAPTNTQILQSPWRLADFGAAHVSDWPRRQPGRGQICCTAWIRSFFHLSPRGKARTRQEPAWYSGHTFSGLSLTSAHTLPPGTGAESKVAGAWKDREQNKRMASSPNRKPMPQV